MISPTLAIAELKDGRRALAYVDLTTQSAEILLILRPEDWERCRRGAFTAPKHFTPPISASLPHDGSAEITDAEPVYVPAPPRRPKLTTEDLLRRICSPQPPHEETPLERIERIQRGTNNPNRRNA